MYICMRIRGGFDSYKMEPVRWLRFQLGYAALVPGIGYIPRILLATSEL